MLDSDVRESATRVIEERELWEVERDCERERERTYVQIFFSHLMCEITDSIVPERMR